MKLRQKYTLIAAVVALLGITLILIGIWIVSREYRFKKYHDKKYGFSISYPAAWSYETNKGGAAVIFFSPKLSDLDFMESVNIVVQDHSQNPLELKAYTDLAIKQMELVFGENFVVQESQPMFVAGRSGHKLVFLGKGPDVELKYLIVWTLKDNQSYQVTYTAVSSQYDRYVGKVNRMIGSFRID